MTTAPPPKGDYRYLCQQTRYPVGPAEEHLLEALGAAMIDDRPNDDSTLITAGYTYFGQFIDHDLTWNRLNIHVPHAGYITGPNFRTARLDLDHMYGDGPNGSPYLYCGDKDAERFKIGLTAANPSLGLPGGKPRDLPFLGPAVQIGDNADYRNTENHFVRQIHVLFLKFHNLAVEQLQNGEVQGDLPQTGTVFQKARQLVIWNYQWLVWNDFLGSHVLDPNSFSDPIPLPTSIPPSAVALPLEFSLAAFRFGHSMVRDVYALNCKREFDSLADLINSQTDAATPLRDDDLIEWGRFFKGLRKSTNAFVFARRIDNRIANTLHQLTIPIILQFTALTTKGTEVLDLPVRTLLRGARAHLASGQEAACELRVPSLPSTVFERDDSKAGVELRNAKLTDNTPLWYYILKEAEFRCKGETLGPLGSRIVWDTIEEVLKNDRESYLFIKGSHWRPPRWKFPGSNLSQPVESMADLVSLVGDDYLLEGCTETSWSILMTKLPLLKKDWILRQWIASS
jgi:hypothetical protein